MENIPLMNSGDDGQSLDGFKEKRNREPSIYLNNNNNINFQNDDENIENSETDNQKSQNIPRKTNPPKKRLKKITTKVSKVKNSTKKTTNLNEPDQNIQDKMNNDEYNLNIPKKKRKRKIMKKNESPIGSKESKNTSKIETTKKSKRTRSVQSKNKNLYSSKQPIQKNRNNTENINNDILSENSYSDSTEISFSHSNEENDQNHLNRTTNQCWAQNILNNDEESNKYGNKDESENDQPINNFLFGQKTNEVKNGNKFQNQNIRNKFLKESSPLTKNNLTNKDIKFNNNTDASFSNPVNSLRNQELNFQPEVEEFYYASYAKPPKLRIDTTLVAQSNFHNSLRISDPYRVTNFSSKILDSESDIGNQNNNYIRRDLVIESGSEYDYSSNQIKNKKHPDQKSRSKKILKAEKNENNYEFNINSNYSETDIKTKNHHRKSNSNTNDSQLLIQSQCSSASDIQNDNNKKNIKSKDKSFNKEKEFVININISDKFNTTRNNNSIDIETPKEINNSLHFDSRELDLNDSQNITPYSNSRFFSKIEKKLNISPAINIQKNGFDLNVINESPDISDILTYRIENEDSEIKPVLQIQQTNSYVKSFLASTNNNNISTKSAPSEINKSKPISNVSKNINHYYDRSNNYHLFERNSRRGESVPRHRSSKEEQKKKIEENYILDSLNRERSIPEHEIHKEEPINNFNDKIVFRNGKFVHRIRVRKNQRSSSVAPNQMHRHNSNNNTYYQTFENNHDHHHNSNFNFEQYPIQNHRHNHQNQKYDHFSNDFKDQPSYNIHHHKINNNFNNNEFYNQNYDNLHAQSENERDFYRRNDHKLRSSSANRVRVKRKNLYSDQNDRQHSHQPDTTRRSSSVPRKITFQKGQNKDYIEYDVNVEYIESEGRNHHREKKKHRRYSYNSDDFHEITPYLLTKEKETQTPKEKFDTMSLSSCEINQSRSVFLDLSQIERNEKKKEISEINDTIHSNSSAETESSNKSNTKAKKTTHSSHSRQSHELSSDYSFNSNSDLRKRKRSCSRASSRSSISISMATPSPSASGLATSDFEIVQTPLKQFIKNKNAFASEISSEFKEEEEESDEQIIKIGTNNRKKRLNDKNKIRIKKDSSFIKDNSIKNHNQTNLIKMDKTNINNMFNVASSSDDEDIGYIKPSNNSRTSTEGYCLKILQLKKLPEHEGPISCAITVDESKSFTTTSGRSLSFATESFNFNALPSSTISISVIDNHNKKTIAFFQVSILQLSFGVETWYKMKPTGFAQIIIDNQLFPSSSEISTTITPTNSEYSSSLYSSNLITRKI